MYLIHFLDKTTAKYLFKGCKFKHKSLKEFLDEYYEPNIEALDACSAVVLTDIHMNSMYEARNTAALLRRKLKNAMPNHRIEIKVYEESTSNYADDFMKGGLKYYLIQAYFYQQDED